MALIDVIKYEGSADGIVWKYPSADLSYASQLVVNQSQEALFYKEGQALDLFGPGTHSLKTGNVPLLEKLVNLPFGGKTPFTAEVYYINKGVIKMTWGTKTPISVEDPQYHITLDIKAFGSYTMQIKDSRIFVTKAAASRPSFTNDDVDEILRPLVLNKLSDFMAEVVLKNNVSVTKIQQYLDETASAGKTKLQPDFEKYGVEIIDFMVESINFNKDDPNFQRIQQILTDKFEIEAMGNMYTTKRTLDIGQAAAQNEGAGSGTMQAGLGLGVGVGLGNMMGGMFQGMQQGQQGAPQGQPGQQAAPQQPAADPNDPMAKVAKLKQMLDGGLITQEEFDAKKKEILAAM